MRKTTLSNAKRFLTPPFVLLAVLKTYQTPLVHLSQRCYTLIAIRNGPVPVLSTIPQGLFVYISLCELRSS